MPSVGPILKGSRVQAGLTLEQISSQTCIPVKILNALEEDDLGQITSAFFYKSFVRQFSERVNLPFDAVAEAVEEKSKFYPETLGREQLHSVVQHAVVKTGKKSFNLRSWVAAGSAAVLLLGCSALYSYWEGKSELSADLSNAVSTTGRWLSALAPANHRPSAKVTADLAKAEADVPAATSPPGAQDNGFRVEVSAIEASWLSIVADGRQTFSGVLEPAQSKIFEGRDNGRVRTGNAGGLKVVFNGKPVGIVGPRGQVRIVVFTKDNYEVLEPARVETASLVPPPSPAPFRLIAANWTVNSSAEKIATPLSPAH